MLTILTMLAVTQKTEDLIAQLHLIDGILSLTDQLRSFFVKTHINVTRHSKKASIETIYALNNMHHAVEEKAVKPTKPVMSLSRLHQLVHCKQGKAQKSF